MANSSALVFPARRTVVNGEALAWLAAHPARDGTSIITSLPDYSEIPSLSLVQWRLWFVDACRQIIRWLPPQGLAIFFQSDVRLDDGTLLDKSYLVNHAAYEEEAALLWHKIVCRRPPGTIAPGRPSYSHMLCVATKPWPKVSRPGPDVLADAGFMPWPRAMGEAACRVACRFLRDDSPTRLIVDPFCGNGSVLAAANAFGFEAIGIDLSPGRCRRAQVLNFNQ